MASNNKLILVILAVMATIVLEQNLGTVMVAGMPGTVPPLNMPGQMQPDNNMAPPPSTPDVKVEKTKPPTQHQDLRRFGAQQGGLNL